MTTTLEPELPPMDDETREKALDWAQQMVDQGLTWDGLSRIMQKAMLERGEWAGVPIPIDGLRITIEDRYPYKKLEGLFNKDEKGPPPNNRRGAATTDPDEKIMSRYMFYSRQRQLRVGVYERKDGKIAAIKVPCSRERMALLLQFNNLNASWAWSIKAEMTAQERLCELIGEDKFRYYFFTGHFLETSERSKIIYVFRRSRPTLALGNARSYDEHWTLGDAGAPKRVIAALCLHPIAYYQESFAGAMTPTDDVISHLMLMRGDEKMFWRRANQHPFDAVEAGI